MSALDIITMCAGIAVGVLIEHFSAKQADAICRSLAARAQSAAKSSDGEAAK